MGFFYFINDVIHVVDVLMMKGIYVLFIFYAEFIMY